MYRYVSHIGPQEVFPVYPGIFDPNGDNAIGIAVWSQRPTGRNGVKFSQLYVLNPCMERISADELISYIEPLAIFSSGANLYDDPALRPGYLPGRRKYGLAPGN